MAISRHNLVPDLPDNNFATLNPFHDNKLASATPLSEGNLKYLTVSGSAFYTIAATMVLKGKHYWEGYVGGGTLNMFGIIGEKGIQPAHNQSPGFPGNFSHGYSFYGSRTALYNNNVEVASGLTAYAVESIVSFCFDADTGNLWYAIDGVWQKSGNPSIGKNPLVTVANDLYTPTITNVDGYYAVFNFGQNPDFSGQKTNYSGGDNPDGSWSDANGIGRFYYEPPAGALALCSRNLQPAVSFAGYNFEETGKALTYNGNVEISKNSPYMEGSYYFDGSSSIEYTDASVNFGTGDFTIEAWIKYQSDTGVYSAIWGSNAGKQCQLRLNNAGRIQFLQDFGGDRGMLDDSSTSGTDLRDDTWHHVAMTRKNGNWKLFVDGQVEYSGDGMSGNMSATSGNPIRIGRRADSDVGYVKGYVANVKVVSGEALYDKNFSVPTEPILATDDVLRTKSIVHNGNPKFVSTSPYNTPTKQRANALTSFGGGSYAFSTGAEGIVVPGTDISDGNTLTIEFWLKFNGTATRRIMSCYTDENNLWEIAFDAYWGMYFRHFDNNTMNINQGLYDQWSASNNWQSNVWTHIVFQKNNSTWSFYKNGKSINFGGTTLDTTINNFNTLLIGNLKAMSNGLTAGDYIADLHITKEAKYTADFTPPTEPIAATENTVFLASPYRMNPGLGNLDIIESYSVEETGKALKNIAGSPSISRSLPYGHKGSISFDIKNGDTIEFENTVGMELVGKELYIGMWVYTRSMNATYVAILSENNDVPGSTASTNNLGWWFGWNSSAKELSFGRNGRSPLRTVCSDLFENRWTHFAYTQDSGGQTGRIWINGVEKVSGTVMDDYIRNPLNPIKINGMNGSAGWDGLVAQIEIRTGEGVSNFKVPRSPSEVEDGKTQLLVQPKLQISAAENPTQHFKAVTWVGDGTSSRKVSHNLGFDPDLIWIKNRDADRFALIADTVRGKWNDTDGYSILVPSRTESESKSNWSTNYRIIDKSSTEFTFNDGVSTNEDEKKFVAWCWKAGGAPADNKMMKDGEEFDVPTTGSITPSKMSVNTKAGFSIVEYTGNGTSNISFPHGLGIRPSLMIAKNYQYSGANYHWQVHFFYDTNSRKVGYLNLTNALGTDTTRVVNNNVIEITSGDINRSSGKNIAYIWSEIAGYSKFGSYEGSETVFVHTGFKPAFVMTKCINAPSSNQAYYSWGMFDSTRSPYNSSSNPLYANMSKTEGLRAGHATNTFDPTNGIDFHSNGFRILSKEYGEVNVGSSYHYLYMAFAESPLNFANAR